MSLTLCDPMAYSLPGSPVHGILQARILEWVAIPFSRRSAWPRDQTQVSCIAGRFFTIWATRAALENRSQLQGCFPGLSLTGFPFFGRISRDLVCVFFSLCLPLVYFLDPIFSVLVFCSLEFLATKLVQLPHLLPWIHASHTPSRAGKAVTIPVTFTLLCDPATWHPGCLGPEKGFLKAPLKHWLEGEGEGRGESSRGK